MLKVPHVALVAGAVLAVSFAQETTGPTYSLRPVFE